MQRPSSLIISASIHATAALALFLLRVPSEDPAFAPRIRPHVLIVAPEHMRLSHAAPQPRVNIPKPAGPPTPKPSLAPRVFQAPALARPTGTDLPVSQVVEPSLTLSLKEPDLAQPVQALLPAISPPPLKTDNFGEVQPQEQTRNPRSGIRASGFSEQEKPEVRGRAKNLLADGDGFAAVALVKPDRSPRATGIQSAAFGDVEASPGVRRLPTPAAANTERPIQILFKPRPKYTEEARRLQIEGEVLIEVLFSAAGEARVLRLVRGLGHGLDESAVEAARSIRYTPAERQGLPVDSKSIVHITFQLAY